MASSDRLERLFNLTATLLATNRPLSAAEIRERVPGYPDDKATFRRAFERDKEALREMGVPLILEPIAGRQPAEEGYRIPPDQYELRDPGLDPDEIEALNFAASVVQLEGVSGLGAVWKLRSIASPATASDADGAAGHDRSADDRPGESDEVEAWDVGALPTNPHLVPFFVAVAERRPAVFAYNGQTRTVDPYRLDFVRGQWYLSGFDHLRHEERSYRLDRIAGTVELGPGASFDRPSTSIPGARLQPWELGSGEPQIARVLVDGDQAHLARQAVGNDAVIDERVDGSIVVELAVTNVGGLRSFVLGFLEHAEILEPPELRREMQRWLEAIVDRAKPRPRALRTSRSTRKRTAT